MLYNPYFISLECELLEENDLNLSVSSELGILPGSFHLSRCLLIIYNMPDPPVDPEDMKVTKRVS